MRPLSACRWRVLSNGEERADEVVKRAKEQKKGRVSSVIIIAAINVRIKNTTACVSVGIKQKSNKTVLRCQGETREPPETGEPFP